MLLSYDHVFGERSIFGVELDGGHSPAEENDGEDEAQIDQEKCGHLRANPTGIQVEDLPCHPSL